MTDRLILFFDTDGRNLKYQNISLKKFTHTKVCEHTDMLKSCGQQSTLIDEKANRLVLLIENTNRLF